MVRSLTTLYDGGKLLTGYGWYSGTVTTGWMMKLFGTAQCGTTAVVSVPTGYTVFTVGTTNTSTSATCIAATAWFWTTSNDDYVNKIQFTRSTLVTEAAEEWVLGTKRLTTAAGVDPWVVAVGGTNTSATFGMGIWNAKLWSVA